MTMTLSKTIQLLNKILETCGDGEIEPDAYEGFDFSFVVAAGKGYMKPIATVTMSDNTCTIRELDDECMPIRGSEVKLQV